MQIRTFIMLGLSIMSLFGALNGCGPDVDPRVSDTAPVVYQYAIEGMHCQNCVDAITDKAMHTDGVVDCRVNLKEKSAIVAMRDDTVEPKVKTGIEKLGYTVTVVPKMTSAHAAKNGAAAISETAASSTTDSKPVQPK